MTTVPLTVNPAPLTITPIDWTVAYGAQQNAVLTVANEDGFVNGENGTVLSGTLSCGLTDSAGQAATLSSTLPPGKYTIACAGLSSNNYAITYKTGTLTVTMAPLTITAPSATMTYGAQTLPTLGAPSYSGFVNGDGPSALSGSPTCALTDSNGKAVTLSSRLPAGTYTVTCSGQTSADYGITYKPGTLTVNPAPLTVTANNQTMLLHGAVPPLTVTYSGFVNGETAAALTAAPSCTTTATSSSPAGSYPITCSGAADPNYTFTYKSGTLQIAYQWNGLAAPLGGTGTPVFKAGSTIPIKFQLTDASGAIVQGSTAPTFAASAPTACGSGAVDATGTTTTGDTGNAFRWDSTNQQYIYNYHSDSSLSGMCQSLTVTLDDGTTHTVTVAFK
ncbi:MAG TPA: MBG domain-containing protein [Thermomicrobiales bacterium]|nr:MBG domain-containing protein [Thermomicrobiales bacterium]